MEGKKKLILIADDDPDIRSELGDYLTSKGFEVIRAENGKDALALYKKRKPAIVISDYRMPKMNGFELFLNIKKIDRNAFVILISAVVDLDPFMLTKSSTAYEFLEKPVDLVKLMDIIRQIDS